MAKNKPKGKQCILLKNGKGSYIVLTANGPDFVNATVDTNNPILDENNDNISFNVVRNIPLGNRRLAIKISCVDSRLANAAAADLTDGMLSITVNSDGANLDPVDVPVDYIGDPGA